jgi:hypothetical protein
MNCSVGGLGPLPGKSEGNHIKVCTAQCQTHVINTSPRCSAGALHRANVATTSQKLGHDANVCMDLNGALHDRLWGEFQFFGIYNGGIEI